MKLLAFLLAFLLCTNDGKKQTIEINFLGSVVHPKSAGTHFLFFCIQNNTSDTLYISNKYINVNVKLGILSLKNEYWKISHLIPPPIDDEQYKSKYCILNKSTELDKESLTKVFAASLFNKNLGKKKYSKLDQDYIVEGIASSVIVLLPHSRSNYEVLFYNKKFSKSCDVKSYLNKKQVFYSFYDSDNKLVNIYY